ncbi:hypothetical protein GQ53DRAFT_805950 [Thozetella sp. PMI_491]|nr:hypothetical protein GQ53DRAFT_805950 [Thozetella sp. PMI_491]
MPAKQSPAKRGRPAGRQRKSYQEEGDSESDTTGTGNAQSNGHKDSSNTGDKEEKKPVDVADICNELRTMVLFRNEGQVDQELYKKLMFTDGYSKAFLEEKEALGSDQQQEGNIFHHLVRISKRDEWEEPDLVDVLSWLLSDDNTKTNGPGKTPCPPFHSLLGAEWETETAMHLALGVHHKNPMFVDAMLKINKNSIILAKALCSPLRVTKKDEKVGLRRDLVYSINNDGHVDNYLGQDIDLIEELVESYRHALQVKNVAKRTPYQERIYVLEQSPEVKKAIQNVQGRKNSERGSSSPRLSYDDCLRKIVIGDPVAKYLRNYAIANMEREAILSSLYPPGDPLDIDFNLEGCLHEFIDEDYLDSLAVHLRFESTLKQVVLPRLKFGTPRAPNTPHEDSQVPTELKGRSDLVHVFSWLRKHHVLKILKVTVYDDELPCHTDEAIIKCLEHLDVETWDWRRVDVPSDVIYKAAPNVSDVALYCSGNGAVLKGWSSSGAFGDKEKFPLLSKVTVYLREGQEEETILRSYGEMFKMDLNSLANPNIKSVIEWFSAQLGTAETNIGNAKPNFDTMTPDLNGLKDTEEAAIRAIDGATKDVELAVDRFVTRLGPVIKDYKAKLDTAMANIYAALERLSCDPPSAGTDISISTAKFRTDFDTIIKRTKGEIDDSKVNLDASLIYFKAIFDARISDHEDNCANAVRRIRSPPTTNGTRKKITDASAAKEECVELLNGLTESCKEALSSAVTNLQTDINGFQARAMAAAEQYMVGFEKLMKDNKDVADEYGSSKPETLLADKGSMMEISFEIDKYPYNNSWSGSTGGAKQSGYPRITSLTNFTTFLRNHRPKQPKWIKIAMIDDGLDSSLGVFKNEYTKIAAGESFPSPFRKASRNYYVPSGNHGARVASLICSICPRTLLYIAKLEHEIGQGGILQINHEAAAKAVRWATECGVHIINMSWTIETSDGEKGLESLREAIQDAREKGIIMFCSASDQAGRSSPNCYPNKWGGCIGIGALTPYDTPSLMLQPDQVEFLLPGERIVVRNNDGSLVEDTGSSLATAIATGLGGLLIYTTLILGIGSVPAPPSREERKDFFAWDYDLMHCIFEKFSVDTNPPTKAKLARPEDFIIERFVTEVTNLDPKRGKPKLQEIDLDDESAYCLAVVLLKLMEFNPGDKYKWK